MTEPTRRPPPAAPPRTLTALIRALEDPGRGPLLSALLAARDRLGAAGNPPTTWEGETLVVLADGLLERLAACGVRPVHRPGEPLSLPARVLARRYEYHGAPLRPGERRKRVVVAAPGWRLGRRLVVRPVVREAPDPGTRTRGR